MNCPHCASESVQRIRMVCMSGTTTSRSAAIGMDFQGDVGIASIGTRSQTVLAEKLSPGPAPSTTNPNLKIVIIGLILALIGGAAIYDRLFPTPLPPDPSSPTIQRTTENEDQSGCLQTLGVVGLVVLGVGMANWSYGTKKVEARTKKWQEKQDYFEKGWICHRCGMLWIP